ncbi:Receptor-like protein kinase FERONIA [Hordeum vulgare]|nr:Receptor-like protein kinase FERONIA [Hordeum vulgare]
MASFNASQIAQTINCAYIVHEFSLNVSSRSLDLTFSPSAFHNGSYAFINGIEIVPMPDIFTTADTTFVHGDYIAPFTFAVDSDFQTMYRLSVGGQAISPKDDTGFYRSWDDDSPYIFGAGYGVTYTKDSNVTIRYTPIVRNYIAPLDVYGTTLSMGPNPQVNLNYNLTWILPVDVGFLYIGHGSNNLAELNPPLPQKSDVDPNRLSNGTEEGSQELLQNQLYISESSHM